MTDINTRLIEAIESGCEEKAAVAAQSLPSHLLLYIIAPHIPNTPAEYTPSTSCRELMKKNPELGKKLKEACISRDFRDFLKAFNEVTQPKKSGRDSVDLAALRNSFKTPYAGSGVDGLVEYLTQNNIRFHDEGRIYYAKLCSFVQSSGTGKSRTILQLGSKGVLVLYMNIRDKTDETNWPLRDEVPAQIISEGLEQLSSADYTRRCCAFFSAIFLCLHEKLDELLKGTSKEGLDAIMLWQDEMDGTKPDNKREKFFDNLKAIYDKIMNNTPMDQLTKGMASLSMQETITAESKQETLSPHELSLRDVYGRFLAQYPDFFDSQNRPKLVIAIDEAHILNKEVGDFRPSHLFCRAISAYSCVQAYKPSVWALFASTNSRIGDFSAPARLHSSLRVQTGGAYLFPPYTLTGWDQYAVPLGEVTDADGVSKYNHIVRYGRPLWFAMSGSGISSTLGFAQAKLCKGLKFAPADADHVLAVLGQRFCLSVCFGHPEAVAYLESAVAGYLRVCASTTEDRNWMFTSCPSEPFLSHAAGVLLHKSREHVVEALGTLRKKVDGGIIEIGQVGELTSRIAWLLCKDLLLLELYGNPADDSRVYHSKGNPYLLYCRKVPVIKFLEKMFGQAIWPKGKDARTQAELALQDAFGNAYVNFSHWIPMSEDICAPKRTGFNGKTWLWRHWTRTAAVQCHHNQPLIDKVIPIYFETGRGTPEDRMSLILISDKAGKNKSPTDVSFIQRNHARINCITDHAYIAVTLDMGIKKTEVKCTYPPVRTAARLGGQYASGSDPCLRIYATGMSSQTFPFLNERVGLEAVMKDIALRAQEPKYAYPVGERLRDLMDYGTSSESRHMDWEHGSEKPKA